MSASSWKKQSSRLKTGSMNLVNNDTIYGDNSTFNHLECKFTYVSELSSTTASFTTISAETAYLDSAYVNDLYITNLGQNNIPNDRWLNVDASNGIYVIDLSSSGNYTSIGGHSLMKQKTAWGSTAIGYDAMRNISTRTDLSFSNTAVGTSAMYGSDQVNGITGIQNAALGNNALSSITTGSNNSAFGYNSLSSITTGSSNSALGADALSNNTTGVCNTAAGQLSLNLNTTGIFNVGVGSRSLLTNTIGSYNSVCGSCALMMNIEGCNNVACGHNSMSSNEIGCNNAAIGYNSMFQNKDASANTAIGASSLYSNKNGMNNVAIGYNALYSDVSGSFNTVVGAYSDVSNTMLDRVQILGYNNKSAYSNVNIIGSDITATGTDKTFISNVADSSSSLISNVVMYDTVTKEMSYDSRMLHKVAADASGYTGLIIGDASQNTSIGGNLIMSQGNVGIGTTSPASKLHIDGSGIELGTNIARIVQGGGSYTSVTDALQDPFSITSDASNLTIGMGVDTTSKVGYINVAQAGSVRPLFLNCRESAPVIALGNVGIGTTNPQYTLDVSGTAFFSGDIISNNGNISINNSKGFYTNCTAFPYSHNEERKTTFLTISEQATHTAGFYMNYVRKYPYDASGDPNWPILTQRVDFNFLSNNNNSNYQSITTMTINNDGYVGIGTTNPNCPLHINRYISASDTITQLKLSHDSLWDLRIDSHHITGSRINYYLRQNYSGTVKDVISIDNGYVGIGTTNPGFKLDVHGNINISGTVNCWSINAQGNAVNCGSISCYDINTNSNSINVGTGNVYANWHTASESARFTSSSGYVTYINNDKTSGNVEFNTSSPNSNLIMNTGHFYWSSSTSILKSNGFIGINNNNPAYPIVVNTNGANSISIFSSGDIQTDRYVLASFGFIGPSDSRIKTNIVDIDDSKALSILRQIQPKTYEYIDKKERGSDSVIGFIAQEIKEIIPKAVKIRKNDIPNFYTFCRVVPTDISNIVLVTSPIDLSWNPLHGSANASDPSGNAFIDAAGNACSDASGNKCFNVKLYDQSNNEIECKTTAILDKRSFLMDISGSKMVDASGNILLENDGDYFLYGQEIDDFHTLDKSAIFTVVTAAVQDIDRIVQSQQVSHTQMQETQSQMQETQSQMQAKQQADAIKIEALEKQVNDLQNKYKLLEDNVALLLSKM